MKVIIEIDLPMPLWNSLLAMHHFQRKKCRDLLHRCASRLQVTEVTTTTPMVYRLKHFSTDLFKLEYLRTIRPGRSKKSASQAGNATLVRKGRYWR